MNRWILGALPALIIHGPASAADPPVINGITFKPAAVVANSPAGTPAGTLDVSTTGMTVKPTVKIYTDSSICTLPASTPPATVTLTKPLVAGNYACTFIAALSNAVGSPFIQTVVLNVQPASDNNTPTDVTIGAGEDTLSIKIAQDWYLGPATYTVKVDGVQVGGTLTAHALHSNPVKDTVTVKGSWAGGNHTVQIQMLEDAWGGSPDKDRNLYVEGATYDGVAVPNSTLFLSTAAPQTFTFLDSGPLPIPDPTLTLSANPPNIVAGGKSTLSWSAQNSASCMASGGWMGSRPLVGTESVGPTTDTNYTLDCVASTGKHALALTSVKIGQAPPPPVTGNTMPVTNVSGNAATNYPFQFGRPFVQGEIPHYPKVVFNGTPVLTQVDVKNRYSDGSVKFAVLSVVLPSLPSGTVQSLTFQDQPTGNTAPVTAADLLTQFPDADATIELTGSAGTASVSARKMLQDGNCKPWTSGPIEVVVQCRDLSTARIYDRDPTGNGWKPFHPGFELSFWPQTKQIQVRYVGEVTNSMALEAFTANVKLTAGKANPAVVFQQNSVPHSIKTRWTKIFWIGGAPEPKVNIDHNIGYLAKTGYLWNFDPSAKIPESVLSAAYSQWQSSDHGRILSPGLWMLGMPNTGYHPDIGPMPVWYNRAIYTGDYRMREVMLGQADLVGAFGAQVREGDPARFTSRAKTASALGLPVTQYVRPYYRGADSISVRSPPYNVWDDDMYQHSGWDFDTSHQPDPFSVPYLVTGDPFYLEGLQLWGAIDTFGPEGLYLWYYHSGQVRSQAWSLREVVSAWGLSPDADPMRAAFHDALDDIFAAWEGERRITGTKFEGTPAWQQTFVRIGHADQGEAWLGLGPPPLHFWNFLAGNPPDCNQWYFNPAVCERDYTPWQVGFLGVAISHAIELGYDDARPTLNWFAGSIIGPLLDPNYSPGLLLQFIAPGTKKGPDGGPAHFTSWADVKTAWSAALLAKVDSYAPDSTLYWPATGGELYWDVFRGGLATIADKVPNGMTGWQRFQSYLTQLIAHTSAPDWNPDPTWDILPRQ